MISFHQGDLDHSARMLVEELHSQEWKVPGIWGTSEVAQQFAQVWQEISGQKCELVRRQHLYQLKKIIGPIPGVKGNLRQALLSDLNMLADWQAAFMEEALSDRNPSNIFEETKLRIEHGDIFLWQDAVPVSMALKNRPTRNGICVSYVYTPPSLRREGYAYACVRTLSQQLLDEGWKFCTLFANQTNTSANHIYQRMGYQPITGFDEYTFV